MTAPIMSVRFIAAVSLLWLVAGCTDPSTVGGYDLKDSLVAIQAEGDEVAVVGVRRLATGTPFELFAVLRAERAGVPIYFTNADALEIDGARVSRERMQPWPQDRRVRVRWFTIEGTPPYSEWPERQRFPRYHAVFRPDWGSGWAIPGDVRPRNSNLAFGTADLGPRSFGAARYHVRVEVYATGSTEVPVGRYPSPALVAEGESIDERAAGVILSLSPPLAPASAVFGLPQVEDLPSEPNLRRRFTERAESGLLFSRAWVLRQVLAAGGGSWEEIVWRPVDLAPDSADAVTWNDDAAAGDLLRAGERAVFILRDTVTGGGVERAVPGVVDYSDLCIDFWRGAAVRPIGNVFTGGGQVELGSLPRPSNH